jgi:predicted acetyltransferase
LDYSTVKLVWPAAEYLPGYVDALKRGWSSDNERGEAAALAELAKIEQDAAAFVASLVDKEAAGGPVMLPDGTTAPRLPGYHRWLWDGDFCGSIGFRWQRGTEALPALVLGHIGYAVVPWKQRRGYATLALREILKEAREVGLRYVELTTDLANVASQKVIDANGGILVEQFVKAPAYGSKPALRYRIMLADHAHAD